MTTSLIDYPNAADARLPATYEAATVALANCERIDECADWANKMEALASYARQSENDDLLKMAVRIKARAIRRCGELLNQVEPSKGGRPTKFQCRCGETFSEEVWHCDVCAYHWPLTRDECWNCYKGKKPPETIVGTDKSFGRARAAEEAGLSPRQTRNALNVAAVPREDFEEQIASDTPPTVTKLAEQGKATRPAPIVDLQGRHPADFAAASQGLGTIAIFVEFIGDADIPRILRGGFPHELERMKRHLRTIRVWAEQTEEVCDDVLGK